MTDPLSVAAAAAGFLSVSGQLLDGLVELSQLCKTIKNAPDDVGNLIYSTQELQRLLDAVARQLNGNYTISGVGMQCLSTSLSQCQTLQLDFEIMLQSLREQFRRHKASQLLMLFRHREIKDILDGIERCQRCLLIAQQLFGTEIVGNLGSVLTHKHDQMLQGQQLLGQSL